MARLLITGMSATGKTTVLDELQRRGFATVDTDYNGWTLTDGTWDEARMGKLLAENPDIIVSGTVSNQGRFYHRFDNIVLLIAPLQVLLDRISTRTNNAYGKSAEQQAEIAHNLSTVEPLLRPGATIELDATKPAPVTADIIASYAMQTPLMTHL